MELIKRHKGLAIVGSLAVILIIIIFIISAKMIFLGRGAEYGDRLNGAVKIDSSETKKLKEEIEALDSVKKVSVDVKGKIIYIIITYSDDTKLASAKETAGKVLTYYSDDVKKCYDFEILLTQNKEVKDGEEDTSFHAAGTKIPDSETISWTKS